MRTREKRVKRRNVGGAPATGQASRARRRRCFPQTHFAQEIEARRAARPAERGRSVACCARCGRRRGADTLKPACANSPRKALSSGNGLERSQISSAMSGSLQAHAMHGGNGGQHDRQLGRRKGPRARPGWWDKLSTLPRNMTQRRYSVDKTGAEVCGFAASLRCDGLQTRMSGHV